MIQVNTGAVQTAISTHSYDDTFMASLICSKERSECWYGCSHWRAKTHTQCPNSFQCAVSDDAYHTHTRTHTLPAHKSCQHMYSSHKSSICASRLGRSRGVRQQKSVFWLISGQNSSAHLWAVCGKLLWERHGYCIITTDYQTGRQTESNSPSEKWQKAREKKQNVNQVRIRRQR